MVATLAFNGSILAALILIPLIYPSALPSQSMPFLMTALRPPKAPPALPHRTTASASTSAARNILDSFQAPRQIPSTIFIASTPEPRDIVGIPGGDTGPGGNTPGGVGDDTFHNSSPRVNHAEPKAALRVSSGTEAGMLVFHNIPQYPVIAKTMHAEGTVVLAATISKAGTIENLRVVSGPSVLQQAALDAVKTWRYRPYLLDGQPVEVETNVEVIFRIQR